jgi:hypothetical protein
LIYDARLGVRELCALSVSLFHCVRDVGIAALCTIYSAGPTFQPATCRHHDLSSEVFQVRSCYATKMVHCVGYRMNVQNSLKIWQRTVTALDHTEISSQNPGSRTPCARRTYGTSHAKAFKAASLIKLHWGLFCEKLQATNYRPEESNTSVYCSLTQCSNVRPAMIRLRHKIRARLDNYFLHQSSSIAYASRKTQIRIASRDECRGHHVLTTFD